MILIAILCSLIAEQFHLMSFRYRKFLFRFTCHFVSESAQTCVASIITDLFPFWVIVACERFRVFIDFDSISIDSIIM